MSKGRKYQDFRLEDVTGGINVRDYPSEIEDKQMISLTNWNFEGNKLVSSKGIKDSGNEPATSPINTLKIDNNDLWTISENKLFKNGIEQESKKGARLKVRGLTRAYEQEINDPNGETISYTESEFEYFPDGVKYYVNIDGVDYGATGQNEQEIYQNLKELVEADGYVASLASEYIYISSNSTITIETPSYTTYVLYLKNIIENSDYKWTDGWVKGFHFNIDGYTDYYYDVDTLSDYGSAIEYDKAIRDGLYDKIEALSIPNIDISKTFLSPGFLEDGTGTIYGKEDPNGYASIILQKATSVEFKRNIPNPDGEDMFDDTIIVVNWVTPSSGDVIILNQGKANEVVIDLIGEGISSSSDFYNWLINNGYPNTKIIYGKWTGQGTTPGDEYGYMPLDINNNTASPVNTNSISSSDIYPANWYGLSVDAFNIDTNTFENTQGLNSFSDLGRANIVVGNMGELILDKDNGGAYYFTDDVLYSIGDNVVGLPTVGTIYNGKIVLGGYEDNDNIVFSQTSTPNQPLNILNFSDYSAGGQSVSGGDKGIITGMKVGENGLYVFKDNSIWYSNNEKDTGTSFNLVFNKITSSGALSQNVITDVQQEVFYLDWATRSVRRLSYEQNLTTLRDTAISREITGLFEALPEEQLLATSSFNYPNYTLSLTDGTSDTITYSNGKTYYVNNKHFVYNVENKSWTTYDEIEDMITSNQSYYASSNGKVYKMNEGNVLKDGSGLSKEYTFVDDVDWKRFGEVEVVGRITAEPGETKSFEIQVLVDGNALEIGEPDNLLNRKIEATDGSVVRFRERIELFDDGQTFQFIPKHSGKGKVEISDLAFKVMPLNVSPVYY